MRRLLSVVLLGVVLAGTGGCSLPAIPGLPGGGGPDSAASSGLWPDVPPLPGSTRLPIDLPLPVKLLVKGFVASAQSSDASAQTTKDYDFVVFQATSSGIDLASFYTEERMSAEGWTPAQGSCGAGSPVPGTGGLCLFSKPAADGFTDQLAIVLLPGEGEGGVDQVAYVRFQSRG